MRKETFRLRDRLDVFMFFCLQRCTFFALVCYYRQVILHLGYTGMSVLVYPFTVAIDSIQSNTPVVE